jgi:hypothetical protein
MLFWLVFGLWVNYSAGYGYAMGPTILLFILLVLLGWKTMGPPISG